METIMMYLDNMFASLPRTAQMVKLKEDLLATMEEKYIELKQSGKTENEAVGIVISEFGNIDELLVELGVERAGGASGSDAADEKLLCPVLTQEDVYGYMEAKRKAGWMTGIGVFMCIAGVSLLILFEAISEHSRLDHWLASGDKGAMIGLVLFFLMLAPAIGLFIFSGMKLQPYEYLQNGFILPYAFRQELQQRQAQFMPSYTLALIAGVSFCVLAPVSLFLAQFFSEQASMYGVVGLLMLVGTAVFLFTYYGNMKGSFSVLLQGGEASVQKREENRVVGAVAAVVWPLATCVFLVSGFIFGQWHINWIIFPITALLFSMFSGAYNTIKGQRPPN